MQQVIYIAPFIALLFWTAFAMMAFLQSTGRVMTATVALYGALYWTAQAAARIWFGYVGPSPMWTYLGILFYLLVGFSLVAMASVTGLYRDNIYRRMAPIRRRLHSLMANPHPDQAGQGR